jgi:hypothetical protein
MLLQLQGVTSLRYYVEYENPYVQTAPCDTTLPLLQLLGGNSKVLQHETIVKECLILLANKDEIRCRKTGIRNNMNKK